MTFPPQLKTPSKVLCSTSVSEKKYKHMTPNCLDHLAVKSKASRSDAADLSISEDLGHFHRELLNSWCLCFDCLFPLLIFSQGLKRREKMVRQDKIKNNSVEQYPALPQALFPYQQVFHPLCQHDQKTQLNLLCLIGQQTCWFFYNFYGKKLKLGKKTRLLS